MAKKKQPEIEMYRSELILDKYQMEEALRHFLGQKGYIVADITFEEDPEDDDNFYVRCLTVLPKNLMPEPAEQAKQEQA